MKSLIALTIHAIFDTHAYDELLHDTHCWRILFSKQNPRTKYYLKNKYNTVNARVNTI